MDSLGDVRGVGFVSSARNFTIVTELFIEKRIVVVCFNRGRGGWFWLTCF